MESNRPTLNSARVSNANLSINPLNTLSKSIRSYKPIILCLNCNEKVPIINLIKSDLILTAQLQCKTCEKDEKVLSHYLASLNYNKNVNKCFNDTTTKDLKYCLECVKWYCQPCLSNHYKSCNHHVTIDNVVNFETICQKHQKKMKYACKTCSLFICKLCKTEENSTHATHTIMKKDEHKEEYLNRKYENALIVMNEIFASNTKHKDQLIEQINMKIKELNKIKEDIECLYGQYKENYDLIVKLTTIARENFESLKNYPIMNVYKNIEILSKVNKNKFIIDSDVLEDNCIRIIQYLKNNLPLEIEQKSLIESTLMSHSDVINTMIQLKDGKLVTGSTDTTIKVWNCNSFKLEKEIKEHTQAIISLVQLQNSKLASGSSDTTIKIWDISKWTCEATLTQHEDAVLSLIPLKSGHLLSLGADKTFKIWNLTNNNSVIKTVNEDTTSIIQLDNGYILLGSQDCDIKYYDPVSFAPIDKMLKGHRYVVNIMIPLQNAKLASGAYEEVFIWNFIDETKLMAFNENFELVYSLCQLCDNTLLVSSFEKIYSFNLEEIDQIEEPYIGHNDLVTGMIELNDKRVASCSWDKKIVIWNIYKYKARNEATELNKGN